MRLRLRAWREDFRSSLFFLPALFVLGAIVVWRLMTFADSRVGAVPAWLHFDRLEPTTLLSAIAGATITVAGLVFSLTAVAVQLASSQFSPRVLRGFRRDRFQQTVLGVVVGTFTYSLLAITTAASGSSHLTVALAVLLAIVSALCILASVDHTVEALRVGEVIADISDETVETVRRTMPPLGARWPEPDGWVEPTDPPDHVVAAASSGWLQQLSVSGVLGALPAGAIARIDVPMGGFAIEGHSLVSVWGPSVDAGAVLHWFELGRARTMQEDPGFGIRQLDDIALRALSKAINDPTTAFEVIVHLGAVLTEMLQRDTPAAVRAGAEGQVVWRPHERSFEDHVDAAFRQLRFAARDAIDVLLALLGVLRTLHATAPSDRRAVLVEQARLVVAEAEASSALPADVERVRDAAAPLLATGSAG